LADLGAEHHGTDLAVLVLQGEVKVTGAVKAAVGDLPFHPEMLKIVLEEILDLQRQLGDRIDLLRRIRQPSVQPSLLELA